MSKIVRLHGSCLYANWGFSDGEIFDEALHDLGLDDDFQSSHDVLIHAVREKLLPLLPVPVETFVMFSTHSPIRVEDKHKFDDSKNLNGPVYVDIAYDDIKRYFSMPKIKEIR